MGSTTFPLNTSLYDMLHMMAAIHTPHTRFLRRPPYAAVLKMAIIEVIAIKLNSGMLSTWRVTPAAAITKRVAEGKTRLNINGIISRETNVAAKIRGIGSGAKSQYARREKKASTASSNARMLSPTSGYLLSIFLRAINVFIATL